MASRQCILAMELEDIDREKFDRSLAKRQICQYFPPSINCAIRYTVYDEFRLVTMTMTVILHGVHFISALL